MQTIFGQVVYGFIVLNVVGAGVLFLANFFCRFFNPFDVLD